MTTQHNSQEDERPGVRTALVRSLASLAGSPDDAPDLTAQLAGIAQLTADSLDAVSYVSVTAVRDEAFTTVAATSELANAVDQAQYADDTGPCVDALRIGTPIAVPDIDTTMEWPGFRAAAIEMGLRASLSVPLFAGSGQPIAVLNIYGHDSDAMAALTAQVWSTFDPEGAPPPEPGDAEPGPGAAEFSAALSAAFRVRSTIQQAIGVLIGRDHCSAEEAYLSIRLRAAESGTGLPEVAAALLTRST